MPKIDAPTVAEHRANTERALLDAGRRLLLAGGRPAVTPAAVGAAVGLARSSVYAYFRSGDEILARIATDAFARWAAQVGEAVSRAGSADARIDAYVRATLELAASGAHQAAVLAGAVPRDRHDREQLTRAHRDLAAPLRAALADRGDPDPALTAELVDGALGRAIGQLGAGRPAGEVVPATLAFVRRAVGTASQAVRGSASPERKEQPGTQGAAGNARSEAMFVVVNELFVALGNRPEFERNFTASMRGTLPGVPGLRGARLLRPGQQDRGYLSVLDFADEGAYAAYLGSGAFRAAHSWPGHAPIDGNRLTTYQACAEISPAARAPRAGSR